MSEVLSDKLMLLGGEPAIYCPGCKQLHLFNVTKPNPHTGARWTWNGDTTHPSFSPSMHLPGRCHSFVRDGQWQFLPDSKHSLAGKTVDIPDLPDWARE